MNTNPRSRIAAMLGVALLVGACGGSGTAADPSPGQSSSGAAVASPTTPSDPPTAGPGRPADGPPCAGLDAEHEPPRRSSSREAKGWYEEAGVELDVLPYGGTAPEAIIAAHQAECGISFQDALTFAAAAGAPVVSTMAILQHTAQEIAVLEGSPVTRPRELDGRVYAGFGYPNEVPTLQAVIRADGGTGEFDVVTLDAAAYEALYAERADFVITFSAWEGIEADLRGIPLRAFQFTDFGFPDFYQVVLACDRDWLAADPAAAKAFVSATVRGFELAAVDPEEAADILVAANPGVFDANPELPMASAVFLADRGLFVDEQGRVGTQTIDRWTAYSSFLFEQGLLTDADGKPLTTAPDYASLFTNDFLP